MLCFNLQWHERQMPCSVFRQQLKEQQGFSLPLCLYASFTLFYVLDAGAVFS